MATFASSALALASAFAAVFSSSVKSVRASISAVLAFRASSMACLAADFATGYGSIAFNSIVPVD